MMDERLIITSLSLALVLLPGCVTRLETTPPRTAREQVMLSYAVRDVVAEWDMDEWRDRRLYLDTSHLESIDRGFLVGEMRDWIGKQGAVLVDRERDAELRLELRSAGVGIEARERLVGIPAFALPVPGASPLHTPEIAIYKDTRRKGVAVLALTGFDTETDRRVFGHGPRIGQTYHSRATAMFIPIHRVRHNIPPEVDLTRPRPRKEPHESAPTAAQP